MWARYVGVWVFFMVICAPQTKANLADKSWLDVFWLQVNYWTSWAILTPGIFWLCKRLYEGPRTWTRYVPGFIAGVAAVSLLHPLIDNIFGYAREWIEWSLALSPAPTDFWGRVGRATSKNSGNNPFLFGVIACVWHAMRYARDLREKQVKALELESRLREAQLQALRSQLNPHFLFNTLHSIAELVHSSPALAEKLILGLGELLRKVLASSARPEVTLAEELEFIRAYLDIEQMRLGDRLKLDWEIAGNVLSLKVPSLILQPLVENAIQHGLASSTEGGRLKIGAIRESGFLHLQVRDSGPGLNSSARSNSGIGLSNTEARLRTIYGDRHRFELISNGGLTVHLRLPVAVS
jgi:two-component system, LytTR family, sensor kinase